MIDIGRNKELDPPKKRDSIEDLLTDTSKIIFTDKILSNLRGISEKYTGELSRQANEYADRVIGGKFDSDEDLMGQAKESLDAIYGEKKRKTESSTGEKLETLGEKRSDYGADRSRALEQAEARYDRAWDANLESLTKKGMTHSSVAELTMDRIASEKERALDEIEESYDRKVASVDRKIERLTASYDEAMKNYEITYAIELEDKLNKLKEKRDRMVDRYEESHKRERQTAYDAFLAEETARNQEYEDREGDYMGSKKENYQERYDYLVGELAGKDKARVARFVKDNETALREYLGLYYDKFIEEVS